MDIREDCFAHLRFQRAIRLTERKVAHQPTVKASLSPNPYSQALPRSGKGNADDFFVYRSCESAVKESALISHSSSG
ncbi:hypothetical protein CCACVL1_00997 [Corchorus capsularis]|uniref:Uncharacterized protein n=1 Tax=Corchorus capsularis TaxID=210143 RepID=A0A1R3KT69_COCAP|nr:hypothetical protein CCACVL1_00997 [Corchorus capsularis]